MVLLGILLVAVRSVKIKNRFNLKELPRTNLRLLIPEVSLCYIIMHLLTIQISTTPNRLILASILYLEQLSVWLALNPEHRVPAAFHLLDLIRRLYAGFKYVIET